MVLMASFNAGRFSRLHARSIWLFRAASAENCEVAKQRCLGHLPFFRRDNLNNARLHAVLINLVDIFFEAAKLIHRLKLSTGPVSIFRHLRDAAWSGGEYRLPARDMHALGHATYRFEYGYPPTIFLVPVMIRHDVANIIVVFVVVLLQLRELRGVSVMLVQVFARGWRQHTRGAVGGLLHFGRVRLDCRCRNIAGHGGRRGYVGHGRGADDGGCGGFGGANDAEFGVKS
jgi:hypothetical protein